MALFDTMREQLRARSPLPPLFPRQPWQPPLSRAILTASEADLLGGEAGAHDGAYSADACRAGLLLWNDDLENAHAVAQGIENATGSFWHAIVHRREGDLANSRYWWRKTGVHPAFPAVYSAALSTLREAIEPPAMELRQALEAAGGWQPEEFVARCEAARHAAEEASWLRRVQVAEIEALLDWCRAGAD